LARTIFVVLWLVCTGAARYDPLSVSGEWMINAYKAVLSPLQGQNVCNFQPTCSQFMKAAIKSQGFFPGVFIGADRLMRDNPEVWAYYGNYYTGGVVNGRIPDPVENHLAWRKPADEPGLLVAASPGSAQESTGGRNTPPIPNLSFADFLYSSSDYQLAAAEYLRVRFASGSPGVSAYAGLMAAESYLRDGDIPAARHAFKDLEYPSSHDFKYYGLGRACFAEADYAGARAVLDSITSSPLSRQARDLSGWTYFRQHRFADGASLLKPAGGAGQSTAAEDELSSMDGRAIRRRSRLVSTLLSAVIPGVGQIYSGRAGDGGYSFLTVAGAGIVTWWFAEEHGKYDPTYVKVSIIGAITALFYAGNVYGANIAARDYNRLQERRYVQRADSLFGLIPLEPDYRALLDSVPRDTATAGRQ